MNTPLSYQPISFNGIERFKPTVVDNKLMRGCSVTSPLKIRQMKTRWGVCNRKDNSVTLNLELIKKDKSCLNYVIVHELSHFVHFNHTKEFWCTVEKYCPDYKSVRQELEK